MTLYWLCRAGAESLRDDITDEMGVIGELYFCADDNFIRSPEECLNNDHDVVYQGVPENPNDSNHKKWDEYEDRKIFIETSCFVQLSEQEFSRLSQIKTELRDAEKKLAQLKTLHDEEIQKFMNA